MIYSLDTNACIALINGDPPQVRERLQRALAEGAEITVSSVVAFELWYGVAKSARKEISAQRVEAFFAGPIALLSFEDDDARAAGEIRAILESRGTPIGAYDVLIAGQARRCGAIVVTANAAEFARVPNLAWENWADPYRKKAK